MLENLNISKKTFSYNLRLNQNWRKINVPVSCEDWVFSHEKKDFSLLLCKNLNIFEETFRITWRNQILNISKARADALFDLDNTWQDYWATVIGKSEFLSEILEGMVGYVNVSLPLGCQGVFEWYSYFGSVFGSLEKLLPRKSKYLKSNKWLSDVMPSSGSTFVMKIG